VGSSLTAEGWGWQAASGSKESWIGGAVDTAAKRKVVVELDGPVRMKLDGHVYRVGDTVKPLRSNRSVRVNSPCTLFLPPGKYQFVFDIKAAGGSFSLEAKQGGKGKLEGKTDDGVKGRVLLFKVADGS